jgi:hypothetical protein
MPVMEWSALVFLAAVYGGFGTGNKFKRGKDTAEANTPFVGHYLSSFS